MFIMKLRILVWRLLRKLGLSKETKVMYIGGSDLLPPPLAKAEEAELIARLAEGEEA